MQALVRDIFLRRTAQVLLLAFFSFIALVPLVSVTVLLLQWLGMLYGDGAVAGQFWLQVISLPLADSTAQLATILLSVFPIVVSTVCYLGSSTSPPSLTDQLNRVGHASILLLLVGAVCSALSVVSFNLFPALVESLTQDPTRADYSKGVLGGVLAFQVLYISKLLGWEASK